MKLEEHNRILVTGATGAVGPRVVRTLVDAGFQVRTLSLDVPAPGSFPENVEAILGDVTDLERVSAAAQGVNAIIHMAALLHINDPSPELRLQYEQINVGGTANIVEAAQQADIEQVLFFSTISVYGDSGGRILDEESHTNPATLYGKTKLRAEKIVLDAKRPNGEPLGTVLRFGAIYGSRIKGNYSRLVLALDRNRFIPIGKGNNRRTLIYDRDVAAAAVLAINHPAAAGRVYNVTDGGYHRLSEIIRTISGPLGKKPPPFSIPLPPVYGVVGLLETVSRWVGLRPPLRRTILDKYTEDIAVRSERIQSELGFKPKYDLNRGWDETVREMRQSGLI